MSKKNDIDFLCQKIKNHFYFKKQQKNQSQQNEPIELWVIERNKEKISYSEKFINQKERKKILTMHDERREEFLLSRFFIKFFIREYLKIFFNQKINSLEDIHFFYSSLGKPFYSYKENNIHFNISHSNNYFVFGFCQSNIIGVDIQYFYNLNYQRIINRFFNKKTKIKDNNDFFNLWSNREAIVKCLGESFFSIGKVDLHFSPDKWHLFQLLKEQKKKIFYQNITFKKNLSLSVSVQSDTKIKINPKINFIQF